MFQKPFEKHTYVPIYYTPTSTLHEVNAFIQERKQCMKSNNMFYVHKSALVFFFGIYRSLIKTLLNLRLIYNYRSMYITKISELLASTNS